MNGWCSISWQPRPLSLKSARPYHWLTADDHLGGDLGKQMSARVAAVCELLKADLEPPDEDL